MDEMQRISDIFSLGDDFDKNWQTLVAAMTGRTRSANYKKTELWEDYKYFKDFMTKRVLECKVPTDISEDGTPLFKDAYVMRRNFQLMQATLAKESDEEFMGTREYKEFQEWLETEKKKNPVMKNKPCKWE